MPDKEGSDDEKKSTKSVVNKRQKQMMGEEGYDVARDMGRVKPSKDKKDATTMPPSKEMEKTRKVNKGPSALELVKKKYKGQIMDVKKEELDLTQVAKAFGGYIIEKIDDGFEDESDTSDTKQRNQNRPKITVGKGRVAKTSGSQKTKRGSKVMSTQRNIFTGKPELVTAKTTYNTSGRSRKSSKSTGSSDQLEIPFDKTEKKPSGPEDLLKKITGKSKKPVFSTGTPKQAAAAQAFRDMSLSDDPKFSTVTKDVKKGMRNVSMGLDPDSPTSFRQARKGKTAYMNPSQKAAEIARIKKDIDDRNPTRIGKSGGKLPVKTTKKLPALKAFKKSVTKTTKQVQKQVAKVPKAVVGAGKETLAFAKKKPFSAAIVASTVVDALRGAPKIPKPPTPKGGKVGRRTAG